MYIVRTSPLHWFCLNAAGNWHKWQCRLPSRHLQAFVWNCLCLVELSKRQQILTSSSLNVKRKIGFKVPGGIRAGNQQTRIHSGLTTFFLHSHMCCAILSGPLNQHIAHDVRTLTTECTYMGTLNVCISIQWYGKCRACSGWQCTICRVCLDSGN